LVALGSAQGSATPEKSMRRRFGDDGLEILARETFGVLAWEAAQLVLRADRAFERAPDHCGDFELRHLRIPAGRGRKGRQAFGRQTRLCEAGAPPPGRGRASCVSRSKPSANLSAGKEGRAPLAIFVSTRPRERRVMSDENAPRMWRGEEGLHVDLRGLSCPEPLVAVLRLIDGGEAGDCLIAHLSQEPLLLYPELNERGWRHRLVATGQSDHVALAMMTLRA